MTQLTSLTVAQFMERYRLLIADADGTIRRCTIPGQPCPNKPNEWQLIPEARDWLREVDWDYYYLGIASNQGGISLGYLNQDIAHQMLGEMVIQAIERFPPIGSLLICPSLDTTDPDRKPNPGMLLKIMQKWRCSSYQTLMVGDMESDRQAADAAGVDFIWAWDLFGFQRGNDRTP